MVKKIRQLESVAEAREKFIESQEERITEEISTLQEEITQLKARISELVSKKIPINNNNMAQANPDPVAIILTNRIAMSNSLQAIRRHIDGSRVLNPVNLGRNFDNITDGLDTILRNGTQLQGIVQENRNLQQNIANITAERDQYQNLLNAENRQVGISGTS